MDMKTWLALPCRCSLCLDEGLPLSAYRPHTLGRNCWCTSGQTGLSKYCWVAKHYPQTGGDAGRPWREGVSESPLY